MSSQRQETAEEAKLRAIAGNFLPSAGALGAYLSPAPGWDRGSNKDDCPNSGRLAVSAPWYYSGDHSTGVACVDVCPGGSQTFHGKVCPYGLETRGTGSIKDDHDELVDYVCCARPDSPLNPSWTPALQQNPDGSWSEPHACGKNATPDGSGCACLPGYLPEGPASSDCIKAQQTGSASAPQDVSPSSTGPVAAPPPPAPAPEAAVEVAPSGLSTTAMVLGGLTLLAAIGGGVYFARKSRAR